MPLPDDLRLRDATPADEARIAVLRGSVGWTVHAWALRAVLELPNARCLVAVDEDGEIVAIGSGIAYGALGFVGNMIVAEPHRRRGIGSAILDEVIEFLVRQGCTRLELFATDAGRPLYARHGFELTDPSAMASVPRTAWLEGGDGLVIAEAVELESLCAYDAPRFGGDRRRLLAMMRSDPERPLLVALAANAIVGYLWLRPDGPRVGPMLADEPPVAAALLREAFERVPAANELTLNVPMANLAGTRWLTDLGIGLEPWEGRMGRGPAVSRRDETIYANAVGALG